MIKRCLQRCFLLALVFCLGTANTFAQEPQMIAPPLPAVWAQPPPDPDTLPPPPELQWEPMPPPAPAQPADAVPQALNVPAPEPEIEVAPPPVPAPASFVPGAGSAEGMVKGTEEIEVWRAESVSPQMPARHGPRFEKSYIEGTDPVAVRLHFDPLAAGKKVIVRPDRGVTVTPPETEFEVGPTGECVISVALAANFHRSQVSVYCDGFRTSLPLSRAPLAVVEAHEALTEGGE